MLIDFIAGKKPHKPNGVAAYDGAYAVGVACGFNINSIMSDVASQRFQANNIFDGFGFFNLVEFISQGLQQVSVVCFVSIVPKERFDDKPHTRLRAIRSFNSRLKVATFTVPFSFMP